jgi:TRAP-type C4-dicarboxylate transport system substrate-binding protein
MRFLLVLLVATLPVLDAAAQEAVKIRLGTLAPRGTTWHRALLEMGEKWRAGQGAGATFIVYTDGSQGSEADMVRRMRVGQLNAALLTVVGLNDIDDSTTALQKMPMIFRSWEELDYVREKLRPRLEKRFFDKGFVVLCWGDAGWVRFFSKTPVAAPADLRKLRLFAWSGDSAQIDIMKALGYQPVVLEVADILPGLQTGLVSAVPTTPFWALTMQLYPQANHMLEMNWAPLVGAVVVTRKTWETLSPAGQKALLEAGETSGAQLRAISRRENEEAVLAMKRRGLKVQPVTPEAEAEWRRTAEQLYPMIRGTLVSADLFDEVQRLLREQRAAVAGQR